MDNKRESRFNSNIEECSDWAAVTKAFDLLPKPALRRDEYGQAYPEWIYRGHKKQTYALEPSIERACPGLEWALMEYNVVREFQSKARMHFDPSLLPPREPDDRLSWLAIMQHNRAPTRLLD